MDYNLLLKTISEQYQKLLGKNLVGIYIHGSIAFGCFNWDRSDIDFIVVVENTFPRQTKLELLSVLEDLRIQAPKKGFEMSVVLKEHCKDFIYPTPYELHFSNGWLDRYLKNPLLLCSDDIKTDYDLAAHFTVIRNVGIVLFGEPIPRVFGNVPKDNYIDSLRLDIQNAKEDVLDNPVYIILNLCRVCAYVKDGLILSKQEGGRWGLRNLPNQYHNLITDILNNYTKGTVIKTKKNQQIDFCEYMLGEFFNTPPESSENFTNRF